MIIPLLVLAIAIAPFARGATVLVGCPEGCHVTEGPLELFPQLVAALRRNPDNRVTEIDLRNSSHADFAQMATNVSWSRIFIPAALSSGALRVIDSLSTSPVFAIPSPSALNAPTASHFGRVLFVDLQSEVLGDAAAAAVCASQLHRAYFLADFPSLLARRARAGFNGGLALRCPTVLSVLGGDMFAGSPPTPQMEAAMANASVLVTFGERAEALAIALLRNNSQLGVIPLRLGSLSSAAGVFADVGSFVDGATQQPVPQNVTMGNFATVGACIPFCDPSSVVAPNSSPPSDGFVAAVAAIAVSGGATAAVSRADMSGARTSDAGIEVVQRALLASSFPRQAVLGGTVSICFGVLYFVVPHVGTAYVFDQTTSSVDFVRRDANLQVPRGAAIAHFEQDIVTQGGTLTGIDYVSSVMNVSICADGVVRSVVTPTVGCLAATGHSAVAFPGVGIVLYGGLTSSLEPIDAVFVFNTTSSTCVRIDDDVNRPAISRYRHNAVGWFSKFVIGGVSDSAWMFIAGGTSTDVDPNNAGGKPIFAFAVNKRQWVQIAAPNRVLVTGRPGLIPHSGQLFVLGASLDAYSVGRATWNEANLAAETTRSEYLVGPVVQTTPETVSYSAIMRGADGAPSAVVISVRSQPCTEGVPSPGLVSCAPCAARTVRDGNQCVPCSERHIQPSATYEEKIACWDGWEWQGILGTVFLVLVTLAITPLVSVFLHLVERSDKALRNQMAAIQLSEAIASLKLERVSFVSDLREATRVERALSCCVRSLKYYRLAMPDAALRIADACNRNAAVERRDTFDGTATQIDAWSEADGTDNGTSRDPGVLSRRSSIRNPAIPFTEQQRSLMTLSGTGAGRLGDDLVDYMLLGLKCELRALPTAIVVFTVDGLPKWADAQRGGALAARLCKIYDALTQAIQRNCGVKSAVIGDRIFASWNEEIHDMPLAAACAAAYQGVSTATLDQMGISVFAGIAFGEVRSGFVGCEGQDAPPFRQHTIFGQVATEALNLSHAANTLRLGVLTPWAFNDVLQSTFIVRFVCGLRLGNIVTRPLYVGEILGLQADADLVWEQGTIAEQVRRFNEAMLGRVLENGTASDAARMLDGLPQKYVHSLQHALAAKQLPLETVPRAWW